MFLGSDALFVCTTLRLENLECPNLALKAKPKVYSVPGFNFFTLITTLESLFRTSFTFSLIVSHVIPSPGFAVSSYEKEDENRNS